MLMDISSASQVQGELCFDGPADSSEPDVRQGLQAARDPSRLMAALDDVNLRWGGLLYTSDAAAALTHVDLSGPRHPDKTTN